MEFRLNTFFISLRVCLQIQSMAGFFFVSSFLFLILTLLLSAGFYDLTSGFFLNDERFRNFIITDHDENKSINLLVTVGIKSQSLGQISFMTNNESK